MSAIELASSIFLAFVLPPLIGHGITSAFRLGSRIDPQMRFVLTSALGFGAAPLAIPVLSLLGVMASRASLAVFWLPLLLFAVLRKMASRRSSRFEEADAAVSALDYKGAITSFVFLALALSLAPIFLATPFRTDAVSIWGYKGKLFFESGGVFADQLKSSVHPDYPIMIPLMEAWAATMCGVWNETILKALFLLFYLGLVATVHLLLRRHIGWSSCIFAFMIATTPEVLDNAIAAYADLPLAFYFAMGLGLYLSWRKDRSDDLLILSGLFLGFAAFTKNEGAALAISLVSAALLDGWGGSVSSFKRKFYAACRLAIPFAVFFISWTAFRLHADLSNDVVNADTLAPSWWLHQLDRVPGILLAFLREMARIEHWNIVWYAFLASTFLYLAGRGSDEQAVLLVTICLCMAAYALVLSLTPYELKWHLETATSRLLLHLAPPAILSAALGLKRKPI